MTVPIRQRVSLPASDEAADVRRSAAGHDRAMVVVGRLTGSRRLRTEGRADQAKGNLKQAGAKVKDAVKH